jgi:hypothetical protein
MKSVATVRKIYGKNVETYSKCWSDIYVYISLYLILAIDMF